jgi:hypothetical protein
LLKKWGIWIVGFVLMVTPLLILLFFWIAIHSAADSLSEGIGEMVLARSQAWEAARPPQPADERVPVDGESDPTEPEEIASEETARNQRRLKSPLVAGGARHPANSITTRAGTPARTRIPARPPDPARTQPVEPSPTPLAGTQDLGKIQEVSKLIMNPSPESRNRLIGMLNDDDPMLRVLSAQGLSSYQDDHVLRLITAAANRETDPSAKRDLDQVVARLRAR